MSLISILFLALLLPCIAVGILTILWLEIYSICGRWGNARYLYTLLRCTIFGFQFPFMYLIWYFFHGIKIGRYSSLALLSQKMKIIMYILLAVWVLGLVYSGVRQLRFWKYFRQICKSSIPASGIEKSILKRLCEDLEINKEIYLYSGYAVKSPFICGMFRTCIYLPVRQFSPDELEMILYHELMHYKQKDVLWKPLFAAIHFLYWFNPLTRYLWKLMREWAEASCDAACCDYRFLARDYFTLLLKMNTMGMYQNGMGLVTMWCENNQELKWRIQCMQRFKQRSRRFSVVAVLVVLSLLASSASTKAAVDGAGRICENAFWQTVDRKKEETIYMDGPEMSIQEGVSFQAIHLQLKSREVNMLPEFHFDRAMDVYVYGYMLPSNKEIMIEFVKDDEETQYLVDQSTIGHFFYTEEGGKYQMLMRNISNEDIIFHGYIYMKRRIE